MKENVKKFLLSNWSVSEKTLLLADVLLFGVLIGWLTSPFKGFKIGSDNMIDKSIHYEDIFDEEEEE